MNNIETLIHTIESIEFSVQYSVLSGYNSVVANLKRDETVTALCDLLIQQPDYVEQIQARILALLADHPHPETMHPHDEALTAYFYVLGRSAIATLPPLIEAALKTPNLFWCKRMVEGLQQILAENLMPR